MRVGMYNLRSLVKRHVTNLAGVFLVGCMGFASSFSLAAQSDSDDAEQIVSDQTISEQPTSEQIDTSATEDSSAQPVELVFNTVILAELDNAINQVNTSLSSSGVFAAEAVRYYFTRLAAVDGNIEQVPENFIIDVPFSICPIILRKSNRYLVKLQLNADQQYDRFFTVSSCQNFELQIEPESHAGITSN